MKYRDRSRHGSRRAFAPRPLDDLCRALDAEHEGCLSVLRHGFKGFGKLFRAAYFTPASGLNGIPVATAELKNPMTGQTWRDAVRQ